MQPWLKRHRLFLAMPAFIVEKDSSKRCPTFIFAKELWNLLQKLKTKEANRQKLLARQYSNKADIAEAQGQSAQSEQYRELAKEALKRSL